MILQGHVEVQFGKEALLFEGGPFVYFGVQALLGKGIFLCDFRYWPRETKLEKITNLLLSHSVWRGQSDDGEMDVWCAFKGFCEVQLKDRKLGLNS